MISLGDLGQLKAIFCPGVSLTVVTCWSVKCCQVQVDIFNGKRDNEERGDNVSLTTILYGL
jgi:hypothetical protein